MRTDVHPEGSDATEPRRQTLRLPGHDYAGGLYYVTQATQSRQRLFGTVLNGRMRLSPAGQMIFDIWNEIPQFCPAYAVDEFVVMPDHIHGIVRVKRENGIVNRDANDLVGAPLRGRPSCAAQTLRYHDYRRKTDGATLFDFMQRFKSLTTARYRHGVVEQQWPCFNGRVWQREYYEHIVRDDDAELRRIRDYIRNNPSNASLLRFGALRYYGNRDLLNLRKTAFLASRSERGAPTERCPDINDACNDVDDARYNADNARYDTRDWLAHAQCVISGFLSPLERAVLRMCRARNIPTIHVLACGHTRDEPLDDGRLVVTPFDPDVANVSAARAAWCNQYVLENADDIVIGHLNPDGMLAFLLEDLSRDTPVTVLSGRSGVGS